MSSRPVNASVLFFINKQHLFPTLTNGSHHQGNIYNSSRPAASDNATIPHTDGGQQHSAIDNTAGGRQGAAVAIAH